MENIDKLKVAELRAELSNRGLDTKGTKPILVTRLREAIAASETASTAVEEQPEAGSVAVSVKVWFSKIKIVGFGLVALLKTGGPGDQT